MLVRACEAAVAETAQDHVLALSQHDEIGHSVTIDVDRVCASDVGQVGGRIGQRAELERAGRSAVVDEELCRRRPARQVQLGQAVTVAVECGDASADVVIEVAFVGMGYPGGLCFLDKVRHGPAVLGDQVRQRHYGQRKRDHNYGRESYSGCQAAASQSAPRVSV